MKKVLFILAALIIASPVAAFHDGGVAHCNGCHTMHNSQDGALVDPDSPDGNSYLLTDAFPSDVCLACHDHLDQSGIVTDPNPLTPPAQRPGGAFVFLLEDNLNDGHGGATDVIPGDAAGHNVIAPSVGISADATLATAPGGTFDATILGCTSCHDPHGTTDFRFLYGTGRDIQGVEGLQFTNPAPVADGGSIFAPESNGNHTAYQSGMSAWCGNCHGDFHNNTSQLIHPSGQAMGAGIAAAYNSYNGSGDLNGGTAATAYLAVVPFEDPANTRNSTAGPSGTSQVSCITCHRAHASSAPDSGRWDFSVTFLVEDGHESGSYAIPDPYGMTNVGDVQQRSLCNKCHKQDVFDEEVLVPEPDPAP